jgi:hypothetical protein
MLPKRSGFGLVVALCLVGEWPVVAQQGGPQAEQRVKPSGPAATKADNLIKGYTARIEKEIAQGQKEVQRLRAELHELIDVRYDMAQAISELRGELASRGTYSSDSGIHRQAPAQEKKPATPQPQEVEISTSRDLFFGFGSALPKDPTPQQREQLRRLAPRSDLKRMIERLREEVDETRAEVDQLAYKLLELREGIPASHQVFGGMGGGMNWFGSIGLQGGGGMM